MKTPEESSFGTPPWCIFDASTNRVEELLLAIARSPALIEIHLRGTREEWPSQKTLWLVQTARRLRESCYAVVCLDLTCFGTSRSAEEFFALMADRIARQLQVSFSSPPLGDLDQGADDISTGQLGVERAATWDPRRSAINNFDRFLLEPLPNLPNAHPVVFLDEFDVVLSAAFGTWGSTLCGWVRSWQNRAKSGGAKQTAGATIILMRSA